MSVSAPHQPRRQRPPAGRPQQDRLPRAGGPSSRGGEIGLGLLGWVGLLLLIVGVPAVLVLFVGYPLPRTAPSKEWLTVAISSTLIINILACVVWIVWAHFVICVLTEWRAIRRGRIPGHVALGGGSQLLARRLVATALLLAGAATTFSQFGGHGSSGQGGPPARPHTVTAARQQSGPSGQAAGHRAGTTADRREGAGGASTGADDKADTRTDYKFYVVRPPHGRRYDSLWDIAQRTLNDPLRYKEIFALNKDRVQADGRKLMDANLIMPGWQLRLPADASGPGVHSMLSSPLAARPVHHGTDAPAPAPTGTGHAHGTQADPAQPRPQTPAVPDRGAQATGTAVATNADASGTSAGALQLALGGGLMLAGLALAVTARRGPYGRIDDLPEVLTGGDAELADMLDRELRRLAAARTEQGRELPQPLLARASTERVVLQLVGGDVAEPPAPWRVDPAGRVWELTAISTDETAPQVPAPYPGLVSVGRVDGDELFLDLEQAPGLISVGGAETNRDVVTAMAVQAATSLWSDGVRVTMVGFGDGAALTQIDPALISRADTLESVLGPLEKERAGLHRLYAQLGITSVLRGRQLRADAAWRPRLVVLSAAPSPAESARLQALVGDGRSSLVVLVVGDTPAARWRFAIDPSGRLDLGALGITVDAHRLSASAVQDIAAMFHDADLRRRERAKAVAEVGPRTAAEEAVPGAPAAAALALPMPADPTAYAVRVLLLGQVRVDAPGPIDPARVPRATEIVAALALHPDGIHDVVLRASIWPRGVSDDVAQAALQDVAQWLGTAPDGQPCLRQDPATGWRLVGVRTDWDALRAYASNATGAAELDILLRALGEVTGEIFSTANRGHYRWLAFGRAARDARVLLTAVVRRAAAMLRRQNRLQEAFDTLSRGVAAVPTSELIWRDLLQLAGRDGPDAARQVADHMYTVLERHHIAAEPQTDALVAQVAPGYDRHRESTGRSTA